MADTMLVILSILIAQGLLGALDVLINHEWWERLPQCPTAMLEQWIHGIRELFYAVVFAGLACFEWHGAWAWLFAGILLIEVMLTGWDFVQEDRTRVLSATERLMHLALSMGGGAYCALLIPVLIGWSELTTALVPHFYGVYSGLLLTMAVGVLAWGVRDLLAGLRLYRDSCVASAMARVCPT